MNFGKNFPNQEPDTQNRPPQINLSQAYAFISSRSQQFITWYKTLPQIGQIVAGVGLAVVGISALGTLMQLVSLAINLAVLAVILYIAYKFLAPQSSENKDS